MRFPFSNWGGGAGVVLKARDLTTLTPGGVSAAALIAAYGLGYTRGVGTAASESVQTSDRTWVSSGIGADVAPVGQRTASANTRGLVIEEPRWQSLGYSRAPQNAALWTVQNAVAGTYTAGDGTTLTGNYFQIPSGSGSSYQVGGATGARWICSLWARAGAPSSSPYDAYFYAIGGGSIPVAVGGTCTQTWQRIQSIVTPVAAFGSQFIFVPSSGQDVHTFNGSPLPGVSAQDIVLDALQMEGSADSPGPDNRFNAFASEYMDNPNGAPCFRRGPHLWEPVGSNMVNASGQCRVNLTLIPKGASTAYGLSGVTQRLVYFDANNYLEFVGATGRLSITVNGSTWSPATALVFNQFDTVDIMAIFGGNVAASRLLYRVSSDGGLTWGAEIDLGSSGSPQAVIAPSGNTDILCTGADLQFAATLQKMVTYASGGPAWAH